MSPEDRLVMLDSFRSSSFLKALVGAYLGDGYDMAKHAAIPFLLVVATLHEDECLAWEVVRLLKETVRVAFLNAPPGTSQYPPRLPHIP